MTSTFKAAVVALMLGVVIAGFAAADPSEDGNDALTRGDYATAVRLWRSLAEKGDAVAQYNLGLIYTNGQGVRQDDAAAASWYRKAAEQGYPAAQFKLGSMYFDGRGVQQDYVRALMWLNLAAARGHKIAARTWNVAAVRLDPVLIFEARRLAREWKSESTPTGEERIATVEKPTTRRRTRILSGDGERPLRALRNEVPVGSPAAIAQQVPAEAPNPIARLRAHAASGASPQEAAAGAGFRQSIPPGRIPDAPAPERESAFSPAPAKPVMVPIAPLE
jgi:hypothetical protein